MNAASTPPNRGSPPQSAHAAAFEARVDTILPTLATKVDVADLRMELRTEFKDGQQAILAEIAKLRDQQNKLFRETLMWVVPLVIAQFVALSGVMFAAANIIAASSRSAPAHAALPLPRLSGPSDRNRTCIPRLGGMCTIHCATERTLESSAIIADQPA
jgi:hypothetical protein